MGFGSPSASTKRRMAPFSTSCRTGSLSRPMRDLSSMVPLAPRRQVEHRDEALQQGDARGGVHDRPGGGLVARQAALDAELHGGAGVELHLVARLVGAGRQDEL